MFLIAMCVANFISPPPPSIETIGIVGNAEWVIILCGYGIDKNR
jgi:hypothetical protein